MSMLGCRQFGTRNSELWVDNEEVENILEALERSCPSGSTPSGPPQVTDACPDEVARFLLKRFELQSDLYRVDGPVNLGRLGGSGLVDRPDLKYKPFQPRFRHLASRRSVRRDPAERRPATPTSPSRRRRPDPPSATDPDVLAIKQARNRTDRDSSIVQALVDAANTQEAGHGGRRAPRSLRRSREHRPATQLQESARRSSTTGGLQDPPKMTLIVRELMACSATCTSTGNYHAAPRAPTPTSATSADPVIAEDVHKLFHRLTGLGRNQPLERLLDARSLRREMAVHRRGGRARAPGSPGPHHRQDERAHGDQRDPRALRGQRGRRPDRPGDPRAYCPPGHPRGLRHPRALGPRALPQHSRLAYFQTGGEQALRPADWMSRNLYRRVESQHDPRRGHQATPLARTSPATSGRSPRGSSARTAAMRSRPGGRPQVELLDRMTTPVGPRRRRRPAATARAPGVLRRAVSWEARTLRRLPSHRTMRIAALPPSSPRSPSSPAREPRLRQSAPEPLAISSRAITYGEGESKGFITRPAVR